MVGAGRVGVNPSMGKGFLFSVLWVPGFCPECAGIKNELICTSTSSVSLDVMDRGTFTFTVTCLNTICKERIMDDTVYTGVTDLFRIFGTSGDS